ncbi:MAG: nitroreductase family protein [Desulfobacteraceae bacterium]|nr:nitroreductase family protein [Desulfobacteraceae bacterium]
MELNETIKQRRSIRKFTNDPVSEAQIGDLLEAARLAPSGSNLQPWRFVIVRSEEKKKELDPVTPYKFALKAPVLFVCCADLSVLESRPRRVKELRETGAFTDVDMEDPNSGKYKGSVSQSITAKGYLAMNVAIAVEHIVLRAVDLGLATCWLGRIDIEEAKRILELPEHLEIICFLPVGYPAQSPGQRPRLSMEEIVFKTL